MVGLGIHRELPQQAMRCTAPAPCRATCDGGSASKSIFDMAEEDFDMTIRISAAPSDKFTIWRKIGPVKRLLVAAPGRPHAEVQHPSELSPGDCPACSAGTHRESGLCGAVHQRQ